MAWGLSTRRCTIRESDDSIHTVSKFVVVLHHEGSPWHTMLWVSRRMLVADVVPLGGGCTYNLPSCRMYKFWIWRIYLLVYMLDYSISTRPSEQRQTTGYVTTVDPANDCCREQDIDPKLRSLGWTRGGSAIQLGAPAGTI